MATVIDKEQTVTWNGDPALWQDFVKRVRLQYEKTEHRKPGLLGAESELASKLSGHAWDVASAELDHNRFQRPDGAAYLLQFLEERLCKAPRPDTGQRLEEFFTKIRRTPGPSMAEWSAQLRESYRRLRRAMARQRKDQADRFGDKAPEPAESSSPSRRSQRRRSDVTSPGRADPDTSFGLTPPAEEAHGSEEPDDPGRGSDRPQSEADGYAELPTSEVASNPGREQRWTEAGWTAWYADRRRRWNQWYEDSEHQYEFPDFAEKDPVKWDQFGFDDVEILPQEILGWLLLRRSGLPERARLSVLSSIGNKLDLSTMERAMRDQEEELLLAEAQRSRGELHRPRRSLWVQQDTQWGLLADEVQDDLDETPVCWVCERPHPEV